MSSPSNEKKLTHGKVLFAHSLKGRPISEWQPLDSHLEQVASLARTFASSFDSAEWAWNVGLLHDIGKASRGFQSYLRRENHLDDVQYESEHERRGNHSSAGAALAEQVHARLGRMLSYVVAGHHAGLPDYYPCDGGMGALTFRLEEGLRDLRAVDQNILSTTRASLLPLTHLPRFVTRHNLHLWLRLLFSCLVDADYLDTEAFVKPVRGIRRTGWASLLELKISLDRHMEKLVEGCKSTPLNMIRRQILEQCRAEAKNPPGLYSLTVPTGGGKTLSAMSFALNHALFHGKTRIIYVIPYTSIIEQTGETLSRIFGVDNVVEHHSNVIPDQGSLRSSLASENWDAPIIVTTNVQFFESLFAARPSRCRKLHNLVNSVIILDEAQLIEPNLLDPCVHAIRELYEHYGATVLLSTATQPTLRKLGSPVELIPSGMNLFSRLKRTEFHFPESLTVATPWEDLARRLQAHDQVLCIVNSRRDCHDLHQLMPEGTIHLSALMCGAHRSKVIQSIKGKSESPEPIRVISTQLVEAGVDLDFPIVYRAIGGLDSIAQAAGRCNREGKKESGDVFVFIPPKPSPPGLLRKGEDKTRELLKGGVVDPHSPDSYVRYFNLFYEAVNDTGAEILTRLTPSDPSILDIPFRTIGDSFKLIDDRNRRTVFVRYGDGVERIEDLRRNGPNRDSLRRLQRYTVNVHAATFRSLLSRGFIEEVWEGFFAQSQLSVYSEITGLEVYREGIPPDDLIGV